MERCFAVYFLECGGNWTDSLFQSRGGFPYCGQCLFRVIGKLLIHVLMSHVWNETAHPLHGELRLRCKQRRLLGSENSCGLLLKTLRGNLKKKQWPCRKWPAQCSTAGSHHAPVIWWPPLGRNANVLWESLGGLFPLCFDSQRPWSALYQVPAAPLNRCQNLHGFGATPNACALSLRSILLPTVHWSDCYVGVWTI